MPRKGKGWSGRAKAISRHLWKQHGRDYSPTLTTMIDVMKDEHRRCHRFGHGPIHVNHKETDLMDGKFGSSTEEPG